jgi:hypothetical protein
MGFAGHRPHLHRLGVAAAPQQRVRRRRPNHRPQRRNRKLPIKSPKPTVANGIPKASPRPSMKEAAKNAAGAWTTTNSSAPRPASSKPNAGLKPGPKLLHLPPRPPRAKTTSTWAPCPVIRHRTEFIRATAAPSPTQESCLHAIPPAPQPRLLVPLGSSSVGHWTVNIGHSWRPRVASDVATADRRLRLGRRRGWDNAGHVETIVFIRSRHAPSFFMSNSRRLQATNCHWVASPGSI